MNLKTIVSLFAALGSIAACGGSGSAAPNMVPPPAPTMTADVQATPSIAFTPSSVSILRGGTVTIAFGSVGHNVYFDNAPAGAPANITGTNANVSKTLTFPTSGTFAYDCHIHPGMRGTVVVVDPDE